MFFKKDEQGQVLVEAAIVMPLMVFFTLGIMQMTMMQQARVMTDYAAYAAARSGVVNNANPESMSAAANIAVLPTKAKTNSLKSLAKAYIMYTLGDYINKAIKDVFGSLGGSFAGVSAIVQAKIQSYLASALGIKTFGFANVSVINPLYSDFKDISSLSTSSPGGSGVSPEDDFDNLDETIASQTTSRGITNREKNILTVAVSYNYELRIPFANWIIFEMWAASQVGMELAGAVWNARMKISGGGFISNSNATAGGGVISRGTTRLILKGKMLSGSGASSERIFQKIRTPLSLLWSLQEEGIYLIPIYGSYSMRMHSNVYKSNLSQELENTLSN